ncbi:MULTISPECIES: sugar transporter [Burkholderia]|uniref:sugar transporter n=1 Tax=Burkholderia TaxID=32008 RepID=UPI0008A23E35|nr:MULTISPECIES: sugar transporter [Burkholderia]MBJ9681239.1 sugar transporter [Burkholderia multivorans]MDR8919549.1 Sugar efflux transporter B [Burkholderia multivorans]MDR8925748.1 Sugar efflux transporter B [Burkholderia multivorans]MDR8968729.1 Sugar efflux transporter B [Burkholderia multivorans]MDR8992041.1 Sugar efflux transporter B [Burkholderia multivorans]
MQTPTTPSESPAATHSWWGVWALALSAFIFNTTEFVPVALLGAIGDSLHMAPTDVGLMLTIYAWTVALTSLPLTLLTRKVERRRLLVAVFALFIASHVVTGVAWNFPLLVIGRLGIAGAHAVFWSISIALAVRLAPPDKKSRALGLIATGTAIAMVAGIPLGRVIGETLGWRMTFLAIAATAVVPLLMLRFTLPELPSQRTGSLASVPALLRNPALILLYAITILVVSAHFTSYTYIEPFVRHVNHASENRITYILVLFGAAGIPAAVCFNRLFPARPAQFLLGSIVATSTCLLILFPSALTIVTLSAHTVAWGGAIICFGLAMQAWVLKLAPDATDLAMSIYSALYNVGIGGGALLGNHIANDFGLPWIGTFGGLLGGLGAALCWLALRLHARRAAAVADAAAASGSARAASHPATPAAD